MKTPYVPHLYGTAALAKTQGRFGWATVGVASSIAWPQDDVWIEYDGWEYVLHGARKEGDHTIAPCISTPAKSSDDDEPIARLFRFTSILGFHKGGYVDITGQTWSSRIIRYGSRDTHTTLLAGGKHGFICNHMPIIDDESARKALAFLREGRRLEHTHIPYSFLSYFKVLESQFRNTDERIAWMDAHLDLITEERAAKRIAELRSQALNVSKHLYESGRCAVAHASVGRDIVDPDVPADRRRIAADLDVIAALAARYIKVEAGVPDEMELYNSRDRVEPWHSLMRPEAVAMLKAGCRLENVEGLGRINGAKVSVRLWLHPPAKQFEAMTLVPIGSGEGWIKLAAVSSRDTIKLVFAMDVANGRMHALLEEGGMRKATEIDEQDVQDYVRYYNEVLGNAIVELAIEGVEPVNCEIVIPVNVIIKSTEEAVAEALERFKRSRGDASGAT